MSTRTDSWTASDHAQCAAGERASYDDATSMSAHSSMARDERSARCPRRHGIGERVLHGSAFDMTAHSSTRHAGCAAGTRICREDASV
jgi:hypothetical protein